MRSASKAYENQKLASGKANPKYVDLLEEDKPIAGQKFACVSFVSPEEILKKKEIFLFEEFVKNWDIRKGLEKFDAFLHFISFKYRLEFADIKACYDEFLDEENASITAPSTLEMDYKTFVDLNSETLETAFSTKHKFQTTTRGLKIRGVYPSKEEAELRCKMLREADPHHDVYLGQVGMWLPFHPEAYKTGDVQYLENDLNQLMHEKTNNDIRAKTAFDERVLDTKRKAIEENIRQASLSGAALTQNIDSAGNLVSVANTNTIETMLGGGASSADIRRELFEGDVVMPKKKEKKEKKERGK